MSSKKSNNNVCNMMLTLVAKVAPNTISNRQASLLFQRAVEYAKSENKQAAQYSIDSIRDYIVGKHTPQNIVYLKWLNAELGTTLNTFEDDYKVPSEYETLVHKYRRDHNIDIAATEDVSRFYPIHIDKEWEIKTIAKINLKNLRDNHKLDNFHLYQAYSAARLWDEITSSDEYRLSNHCLIGLNELCQTEEWNTFISTSSVFFELGTGAPKKTEIILNQLKNTYVKHKFIWIDASTPMLEHNVSQINMHSYPNIDFSAVSSDFEDIEGILSFLRSKNRSPINKKTPKCFFILGFTLSNLDEADFLKKYSQVCNKGDILVFPMEFIPSQYEDRNAFLEIATSDFGRKLLASYDFPKGRELAVVGLGQIHTSGAKPIAEAHPITPILGDPSFDCIGRSIEVKFSTSISYDEGATRKAKKLQIVKSSRFFEADFISFLKKHDFEIAAESSVIQNTKSFIVKKNK